MHWVYPVVSRRAQGVSVGINLNPNRACNWRCIYCQVPELVRGTPPAMDAADLNALGEELRVFLADLLRGDFMETRVPPGSRRLNDIAISGDGEPTLLEAFPEVVSRVGSIMEDEQLVGSIKLVLITNGSRIQRQEVAEGIAAMAPLGGEVWFKLDAVGEDARARVNDVRLSDRRVAENLARCAELCPTRLQTCLFALDGEPPAEQDLVRYLDFVAARLAEGVPLKDAMLYTLARPPLQPEGPRLAALEPAWMETFAVRLREIGLPTTTHV